MRPSAVFAEFCAFLINCPHPCVTGTGEEEEEMLKCSVVLKQAIPVNKELIRQKESIGQEMIVIFGSLFHRQVHNFYC